MVRTKTTTTTATAATKRDCRKHEAHPTGAPHLLRKTRIHAEMRAWAVTVLLASLLGTGCKHHGSVSAGSKQAMGSTSHLQADRAAATGQQAGLLNLQTTEMETDVPKDVQHAIPAFKDALVRLSDDVLATQPATASAKQVEQALTAVLPDGKAPDDAKQTAAAKAAGKNEYEIPEKGDYGGDVKASVSDPQPGLLLVDTSFGIMCGEDNILLGYSNANGKWQRVLRWQAAAYDKVSGAFGDMFTPTLLEPKRDGHPVLLVVHGTPWCTSTESGFAMDAFELDPAVAADKPFWHDEHSYRRADDSPGFQLKTTRDGFEVRTSVDDLIADSINRIGVMRYALSGNTMQRTLPIAMNSRETVSEWLDLSREQAELFTDAPPASATWQMWSALTYSGKSTDDAMKIPSLSYGDVRACSDAKHYQVELTTEVYSKDNKTHAPGPSYFVQVQEMGNGYRIHGASLQPDASCHGSTVRLKSSGYESDAAGAQ